MNLWTWYRGHVILDIIMHNVSMHGHPINPQSDKIFFGEHSTQRQHQIL